MKSAKFRIKTVDRHSTGNKVFYVQEKRWWGWKTHSFLQIESWRDIPYYYINEFESFQKAKERLCELIENRKLNEESARVAKQPHIESFEYFDEKTACLSK